MSQVLSTRNPLGRALAIALSLAVFLPLYVPAAQAGLFGSRRGPSSASGRGRGGGIRSGRLLGGVNPAIPYVVSPRHTWLEDDTFTIEWNPVAGATRYTVSLWRWSYARDERDALVWQTTTAEAQVPYSGGPALERGRHYSVEVVTDGGVSSTADAGDARAGFQLLFAEDLDLLERDRRRVERQNLSPAETAFTLAALYAEERLYSAATDILTPIAEAGTNDPWIHKALGDVQSYIGLNQSALTYYRQAQQLATAANDGETQAVILTSLGAVSATLNRLDEAIEFFEAARQLYQQQSADSRVAQLQRRIELLEAARQSAGS